MSYVENIILWTFALYGIWNLINTILFKLFSIKKINQNTYIVIAVKDGENNIEDLIRTTVFKLLYNAKSSIEQIYVVDLNSSDNTRKIVKKFEYNNEYIRLIDWNEFKDIIEQKV